MDDLPDLVRIENEAILRGGETGFLEPHSLDERRRWFEARDPAQFPTLAATREGTTAGFLWLSPYRPGRPALRHSAEVTLFIAQPHQGAGAGRALLEEALARAPAAGITRILAFILAKNDASGRFFARMGFERWGTFPGVATIDGAPVDHHIYGLSLDTDSFRKSR